MQLHTQRKLECLTALDIQKLERIMFSMNSENCQGDVIDTSEERILNQP